MRSDRFDSQVDRTVKLVFFTFRNMYVSWLEWDKILISQLSPVKFTYFANLNEPRGGPHENEFWQFSNTKLNIISSQTSKDRWKKWVICLVFFFASWLIVLKLLKIVHFLQICADLCKKSKSIKENYLDPSEIK